MLNNICSPLEELNFTTVIRVASLVFRSIASTLTRLSRHSDGASELLANSEILVLPTGQDDEETQY